MRRPDETARRPEEDLEIEPRRAVLDVPVVPFDAVVERRVPPQTVDLGPTRHSGLHPLAVAVSIDVLAEELRQLRPLRSRPDEAHLAADDVHELRDLVKRRAP